MIKEKNNEHRIHQRIPYRTKVNVYRYYDQKGVLVTPTKGIVLEIFDMSLGGLGVLTTHEFLMPSTLEFTLYLEDIPYAVMAKIAWSQHNQFFFRYGLEIIGHQNMLFRHLKKLTNRESIHEKAPTE